MATSISATPTSPERMVDAFEGPIKRVWTSPLYLLALLVVAVAMVLLPLVYIAMVCGVGYGLYYHATENITILQGMHGIRGRLLGYVAPLVIGAVLLLFMIKPLFARQARREKRLSLVRDNEPILFSVVERLCETVGAPKPRRIDVDCDINASASFRRGLLSMLGSDLVLTIGVPLAAGLSLRQFVGVLAHEFGHFTQGLGMRLSYVIRTVDAWFARVVYERDAWDERLIELSETEGTWLTLILLLTRLFVWLTRRILWVLMIIGHLISCGMLRQMEYDADRYEARVAGSDAFAETVRRLHLLNAASELVHADLAESWKDGRLPDNFPVLLVAKVGDVPKTVREKITKAVKESKAGLWSTHPSDAARVRRARKEKTDGVFRPGGQASALFANFKGLSKAVTLSFFQDVLGPRFRPDNLISTAALARRQERLARGEEAANRYFQGCLTPVRPLKLDRYFDASRITPQDCLARLKQARAAIQKSLPVVSKAYRRYVKVSERASEARQAQALLKSRVRIDPKAFHLKSATLEEANQVHSRAEQEKKKLAPDLATIETVVRLRLECALTLLQTEQAGWRLEKPDKLRGRSADLLDALAQIHNVSDAVETVRKEFAPLYAMYSLIGESGPDEDLARQTLQLMEDQRENLAEIRTLLSNHPYPFEHADGRITLTQYAIPTVPTRDDLTGMLRASDRVMDNLDSLYVRLMGELARIAEQVEAALGLRPLPRAPAAQPTAPSQE
ncbi:MAG TPA: M48 family metalloprotease [Phycisphaerae bacterium]|nr:M48 family metalloprotease [Phycisphaerae bacterium]